MRRNVYEHPMSGMGLDLSTLWDQASAAATTAVNNIIQQAPAQIMSQVTGSVAANPQVQAAASNAAQQQALTASLNQYDKMKADLAAQIAAIKANPGQYIQQNPGKVIMVVGGVVAIGAVIYIFMRGLKK